MNNSTITKLYNALASIIEIGKRDLTNPKYDGHFDFACDTLSLSRDVVSGELPRVFDTPLCDGAPLNKDERAMLDSALGCFIHEDQRGEPCTYSVMDGPHVNRGHALIGKCCVVVGPGEWARTAAGESVESTIKRCRARLGQVGQHSRRDQLTVFVSDSWLVVFEDDFGLRVRPQTGATFIKFTV